MERMEPLVYVVVGAVVIGLAVVLQHERRQASRLAERSRELERLSSELLRANRMKNDFLANHFFPALFTDYFILRMGRKCSRTKQDG